MKHDCDAVLLLLSLPACLVLFFFCHLVLLKAKADSTRQQFTYASETDLPPM